MERIPVTAVVSGAKFRSAGYVRRLTDDVIHVAWESGGGKEFNRVTGWQVPEPPRRAFKLLLESLARVEAFYRASEVCPQCHGSGRAPVDGEADPALSQTRQSLLYPECGRCEGMGRVEAVGDA